MRNIKTLGLRFWINVAIVAFSEITWATFMDNINDYLIKRCSITLT